MTNTHARSGMFAMLLALAPACGTKYVAELDSSAQAGSGESGSSEGGDTAGHSGPQTTAPATTEDSGDESTGGAVACAPDGSPSCLEPGDVVTTYFAIQRAPIDLEVNALDSDCTLTSSVYDDFGEFQTLVFACDDDTTWTYGGPLPTETVARLVVDGVYHVRWDRLENFNNTQVFSVSEGDGTLDFLAQRGSTIDGVPSVYGAFTLDVQTDVCDPPCLDAEVCWSQDQQILVFGFDGETVEVGDHHHGTIGDYSIAVGQATGVEKINPDAAACEFDNLPIYDFIIGNVAAL